MRDVHLILPEKRYLGSYLEACQESEDSDLQSFFRDPNCFDTWKDNIFKEYERNRLGIGLTQGIVPSTEFWLVEDNEFIGRGAVRHFLNERLERFGGHIGYAIRKTKQNIGYGNILLKLLLIEANKIGIQEILITCNDTNLASARIIEKNGGVLIDIVQNIVDGKEINTRRYRISDILHK